MSRQRAAAPFGDRVGDRRRPDRSTSSSLSDAPTAAMIEVVVTDRIRVGLIGTSWWTETFHVAGLRSDPRADIAAVCGQDRRRTDAFAARIGAPRSFTDHRDLLTRDVIDAVVIAAPDDLHGPIALDAFAAGLHVLCEKPLARSAGEAREMLDAAENAGTIAMMMFSWRWFGVVAQLRQLVHDGYVGNCHDAHFVMHGGYASTDGYNWRFDPGRGGGILSDYGSHLIDLARWIVGDVVDVVADAATHHRHPDLGGGTLADAANDSSLLLLRFRSGAHGTIEVAGHRHVGPLPSWEVRVYGDEGSLEAEVEPPEFRLRGRRRSDPTWAELPVLHQAVRFGGAASVGAGTRDARTLHERGGRRSAVHRVDHHRPATRTLARGRLAGAADHRGG